MELMIDFETLALGQNAVCLEMGWALYELAGTGPLDQGTFNLDVSQQMADGREISYSTIKWWMGQNDEARDKVFGEKPRMPMHVFCREVKVLFATYDIKGLWCKGLTFDVPILASLYMQYSEDKMLPWHYRAPRDLRTLTSLVPDMPVFKPEIPHSGEADCVAQVKSAQYAWQKLMGHYAVWDTPTAKF